MDGLTLRTIAVELILYRIISETIDRPAYKTNLYSSVLTAVTCISKLNVIQGYVNHVYP